MRRIQNCAPPNGHLARLLSLPAPCLPHCLVSCHCSVSALLLSCPLSCYFCPLPPCDYTSVVLPSLATVLLTTVYAPPNGQAAAGRGPAACPDRRAVGRAGGRLRLPWVCRAGSALLCSAGPTLCLPAAAAAIWPLPPCTGACGLGTSTSHLMQRSPAPRRQGKSLRRKLTSGSSTSR